MIEISQKWLDVNYVTWKDNIVQDKWGTVFILVRGVQCRVFDYGYKEEDYQKIAI